MSSLVLFVCILLALGVFVRLDPKWKRDEPFGAPVKKKRLQPAGSVALVVGFAALGVLGPRAFVNGLGAMVRHVTQPPVRVPRDLSVPDSFPLAIRVLEELSGTRSRPLMGVSDRGESITTPGVAVELSDDDARAVLEGAHSRFLRKGFYLFRAAQNLGASGEKDVIALLPTPDPYEVFRLMQTNGDHYGKRPRELAMWFRELDREYDFELTGIGFDFVEGRFTGRIRDPQLLARRLYDFCPDIVNQGTGSVDALARELEGTKRLYCWWD